MHCFNSSDNYSSARNIASLGRLPLFAAYHGDDRSRPLATMGPHTSSDK